MQIRCPLVLIAVLSARASPASADAPSDKVDEAKRIGKKVLVGETADVSGLMYSFGAGWQSTKNVTLSGAIGYAWGKQRTGLLNPVSVHHISLEPVVWTLTDDFDPGVDIAAMLGHSWRAIFHFSLAIGANVRVTPDVQAGPLAKLRMSYRQYGVYFYGGALYGDTTDAVVGVGFELFHLPGLSVLDRAKSVLPTLRE